MRLYVFFTPFVKRKFRYNLARCERFQPETSTCWRGGNIGPIFQKSAFETVQVLQSIPDLLVILVFMQLKKICLELPYSDICVRPPKIFP